MRDRAPEVNVESWKWTLIGLALSTILWLWLDGSIQTVPGYALIAGTYLAVWTASRELKGKPGSPREAQRA